MNKNSNISLTADEKELVIRLNHPFYTIDFLDEWINRHDDVYVNAPAALQACTACGFYQAIKAMAKTIEGDHVINTGGWNKKRRLLEQKQQLLSQLQALNAAIMAEDERHKLAVGSFKANRKKWKLPSR